MKKTHLRVVVVTVSSAIFFPSPPFHCEGAISLVRCGVGPVGPCVLWVLVVLVSCGSCGSLGRGAADN